MKKRANPRLIGLFVLGGLGLFIAAVILYGMRDLFVQKDTYVSFFRGSVRGLGVGAPVSFRGIDIGQVKEIQFRPGTLSEQKALPPWVPVCVERPGHRANHSIPVLGE